jgi:hypothetical protein
MVVDVVIVCRCEFSMDDPWLVIDRQLQVKVDGSLINLFHQQGKMRG